MSISFACPECRAQVEVGDEHAGQSAQCPRCQRMLVIPSPKQPLPILIGAEEAPVSKPRPEEAETPPVRPRRFRPAPLPKQPTGPIWPWVVGIFAAGVTAALLVASFAVLVFWRKLEPSRPIAPPMVANPPMMLQPATRVTAGQLQGNRAVLTNGVFQIRSALAASDPRDPEDATCHVRTFEVELRAGQVYVLEQDSNQFDCYLRVENLNRGKLVWAGDVGLGNAFVTFQPQQTANFGVVVSTVDPGVGPFTLTIRERDRAKPMVP